MSIEAYSNFADRTWRVARRAVALFALIVAAGVPASVAASPLTGPDGPARMEPAPDELRNIGVDERRDTTIPLDAQFVDDTNEKVTLAKYFGAGKRPVILQLGYYGCPMLCDYVSRGLADSLKDMDLAVGVDFDVVFVSIDPNEQWTLAQSKKRAYVQAYGRDGKVSAGGLHFLTGHQDQIVRVAKACGVKYKWVPSAAQFSHPAALVVCSPQGRITSYLYGVKFEAADVRAAVHDAAVGKIGAAVEQFALTCFQFDGNQGKHAKAAMTLMRVGGAVTVLALGTTMFVVFRREARRNAREAASDGNDDDDGGGAPAA
jgi:protein SCO1/2